jgi:phage FluMu gp28-like protein
VVVEKSRRTGYSWAIAADAMLTAAATKEAGGSDVLYMGYNLEMAREFIDYVADWARQVSPAAVEVQDYIFTDPENPQKEIKAFRVEFASGFKVLALPSVPRALRGMQGVVILDEAAFHDDLKELLKAAFALLIWGGKVVVISTHDGETNPFNELVQDIRAGRKPYKLLRCTFDDALADGLYRRICLTRGDAWTPEGEAAWRAEIIANYGSAADEELFVIPSAGTGAWLPGPLIEARMEAGIPVVRWEAPQGFVLWPEHLRRAAVRDVCEAELLPLLGKLDPDTPHAFGWDFGRYHDLSVFWPLAIGKDLVKRTPFTLELRGVPSDEQKQILWYCLDRMPRLRAGKMDAGGIGFGIAEATLQKYGERIEMVMLNEPWYRENTPGLKADFEDAMLVVPQDRETMDDLRLVRLVRGIARVPDLRSGVAGKKRHGDAFVALLLARAASKAEAMEYGYQAVAARAPAMAGAGGGGDEEDRPRGHGFGMRGRL